MLSYIKKNSLYNHSVVVACALLLAGCSSHEEKAEFVYARKVSPYYTVQDNETVQSIAEKFSMNVQDFISVNELNSPYILFPGQKVIVYQKNQKTEHVVEKKVTTFESGGINVANQQVVDEKTVPHKEEGASDTSKESNSPSSEEDTSSEDNDVAASSDGKMKWPVRGKVIKKFGEKRNGQVSKGISIAAPEGTPVYAAETGVVFKAQEVDGYGKTVILTHDTHSTPMYTIYSNLKVMLVKPGQKVDAKTVIGRVGKTGGLKKPELHFQVKKEINGKKEAVNPLNLLK